MMGVIDKVNGIHPAFSSKIASIHSTSEQDTGVLPAVEVYMLHSLLQLHEVLHANKERVVKNNEEMRAMLL
jgi:hypothetical protein